VSTRPKITRIETYEFRLEISNRKVVHYEPGHTRQMIWSAHKVDTDQGISGEHFTWAPLEFTGVKKVAPALIGRDALDREAIYTQIKLGMRTAGRLGLASIDNCLWDIAGKHYGAPVYELLGGSRTRLPVYASTLCGDVQPDGLNSPEAYADFAQECLELGYRGFKIHVWCEGVPPGPIDRDVALVHAVGQRVGGKMDVMIDASSSYETFMEALKVGWACDEEGYYWYEDPFKDGGVAHYAHRRLRETLKTPLLQGEHERGLEDKANFLVAGATDLVRGDAEIDGITATMKLAHAAEALGMDIELHGTGPATRHCVASIRNTNYYEWALVHPVLRGEPYPFCLDEYGEGVLDAIGADGCVPVPQAPGLGVPLDWDWIRSHAVSSAVFD
jgi:L-alanine-DL-glutamate epimerase-like enolase superfamily enzyme